MGPHLPGLRVIEQYDYSRIFRYLTDELGKPYAGERARPLQTLVWYPAKSSPAKPMTVRDYMDLWSTETSFGRPKLSARAKEWRAAMRPTLEMPLRAVRDAEEASGCCPLVIYAPSFSSVSWENADLCEYLASHGFVVIATASMGATSRNMTADLVGIAAQAADISFLIGYARTLANVDLSTVAVAGFSWGGISNLLAAARDNRIRALVALDGSLRFWPGLVRRSEEIHPQQMTIPLMALAKGEWTLEEQARYLSPEQIDGPNVMNAWTHGDLFAVHMLGMTHREFSSMFQRNEEVWKDFHDPEFPDKQRADYGRADGITGYAWMARYTLQFLNAYLKEDAAALTFLKNTPAQNGVPKHFIDVSYRAASGVAASVEALRAEVGRQGFENAGAICTQIKQRHPTAAFSEVAFNDWAEGLIDEGRLGDAITLLDLNVSMNPKSSYAHASLARARQLTGDVQGAIQSYRKSLENGSVNPEASRKLRELEREAPMSGADRDAPNLL